MTHWYRWLAAATLLGCSGFAAAVKPPPALPPLALDATQQATLAATPVLRLGVEANWAPVEYIDAQGRYSGVISGYMALLEQQLGIRFEVVRKGSWSEVLAAFERGEIDVLSALGRTAPREAKMRFTEPYIVFSDGLIVRSDEPYVEHLQDFPPGRRLAVVQDHGSNMQAAAANPQLVAVPVRSTEEALFAVSTGRADLAISSLAVAYQLMQTNNLSTLRVAASYDDFEQQMAMAVQPRLEALVPLFNQALQAITPAMRSELSARWTAAPADRQLARSTVVFWILAATLLLLLLVAWVLLLLAQQRRRQQLLVRAEEAEASSRAMIEAVPAVFWTARMEPGKAAQVVLHGNLNLKASLVRIGSHPQQQSFEQATRFMSREDRGLFQQLLDQHGQTLSSFRFEHRIVDDAAHEVGWAYIQAVPRRDGEAVLWYGCSIDISERKTLEAALVRSRNQLAELAAGVPGALWQFRREKDGSEHYSYMSEGIVGITGRSLEDTNRLVQSGTLGSVHPEDLSIVHGLMQRLTEKPGIDEARYRLLTTSGAYKWVQVAARAMPVGADGALVWNGITLDASRLQETEAALRFEQQRIQDLADSLSGALWRMRATPEGDYVFDYISEGVVAVTGRSAKALMRERRLPVERIDAADRARVLAALQNSAATGEPLEIEYTLHPDDSRSERAYVRAGVRYEAGLPVWTGVLLNVSERYRLEGQLADARSRIEDIAANFPGAIFQLHRGTDGRSRFTYVSEGITLLTGRPPRTVGQGAVFQDYENIHPDDRERVRKISQTMIDTGHSAQFDYRLLDNDRRPRWVHCAMTVRRQDDGTSIINGLLLDAEESKQLEDELRAATSRAEAASLAKSRFLANMSHEIRTPMNAVIGLAYIALSNEANPQQLERLGKIHRAGKSLLKLLNDILEYARLEAGKFTPVVAPFDLQEINDSLRLFCATAAETKGLGLVIDCADSVQRQWLGDATRIQQILLNLLTNAIKFTERGDVRLSVQPRAAGPGLCFTVQDSGIGMSEAQVQRAFEAFEQASHETERRHGGSGLGLSITRELVVALGGHLAVHSTPGEGSVFTVELPLQPTVRASAPPPPTGADIALLLARLAAQLAQRDTRGARDNLALLRQALLAQGRESELHTLERQLAGFDIEAAQIELAQLRARWGLA